MNGESAIRGVNREALTTTHLSAVAKLAKVFWVSEMKQVFEAAQKRLVMPQP